MAARPDSETLPVQWQDHLQGFRQDRIPTPVVWSTVSSPHTPSSRAHLEYGERLWKEQCDRDNAKRELLRRDRAEREAANGGVATFEEEQKTTIFTPPYPSRGTGSTGKMLPSLPLKAEHKAAKSKGGTRFPWCRRKPEASGGKSQDHEAYVPRYTYASASRGRMRTNKDSTPPRWCFWRRS